MCVDLLELEGVEVVGERVVGGVLEVWCCYYSLCEVRKHMALTRQ